MLFLFHYCRATYNFNKLAICTSPMQNQKLYLALTTYFTLYFCEGSIDIITQEVQWQTYSDLTILFNLWYCLPLCAIIDRMLLALWKNTYDNNNNCGHVYNWFPTSYRMVWCQCHANIFCVLCVTFDCAGYYHYWLLLENQVHYT